MNSGFAMRAMGKGSVASIVRVGLIVAWWVLWFTVAMLAIGAVAYGVVLALVANGVVDPEILSGGAGQIRAPSGETSDFNITYDDPGGITWPIMVPALLIAAVALTGALMIVWRLRKLFDSFCSGDPFRRENADHLRAIWVIMLVVEVSRYVLGGLTDLLVSMFGTPEADASTKLEGHFDLSTWGAILILIVLAEVFREGARLREEQELTI